MQLHLHGHRMYQCVMLGLSMDHHGRASQPAPRSFNGHLQLGNHQLEKRGTPCMDKPMRHICVDLKPPQFPLPENFSSKGPIPCWTNTRSTLGRQRCNKYTFGCRI